MGAHRKYLPSLETQRRKQKQRSAPEVKWCGSEYAYVVIGKDGHPMRAPDSGALLLWLNRDEVVETGNKLNRAVRVRVTIEEDSDA